MCVNNFFTPDAITVPLTQEGAYAVYNSVHNHVTVEIQESFDESHERWLEIMREFVFAGKISAFVWIDETISLRERMVALSINGVDEIKLISRTKKVAETCLQDAISINQSERLGLRILV